MKRLRCTLPWLQNGPTMIGSVLFVLKDGETVVPDDVAAGLARAKSWVVVGHVEEVAVPAAPEPPPPPPPAPEPVMTSVPTTLVDPAPAPVDTKAPKALDFRKKKGS